MATKKIGIPVSKTGENSVGLTLSYIEFAEQYGEVVLLMPNHTIRRDIDLLILPGGPDIDPRSYGAMPSWFTGKPDLYKEYFDARYLPAYIQQGTSIFGIN